MYDIKQGVGAAGHHSRFPCHPPRVLHGPLGYRKHLLLAESLELWTEVMHWARHFVRGLSSGAVRVGSLMWLVDASVAGRRLLPALRLQSQAGFVAGAARVQAWGQL